VDDTIRATDAGFCGRDRFLRASRCDAVDGTPVWLMRQAGRALPEYRALRERHSFRELVRTPELATEVTLQPIRRFGFDAAVIFSDILVVSEALGQGYDFREGGGIQMEFQIRSAEQVERLDPRLVPERLDYLSQAIRAVRRELGSATAVLGFAGSPWTLANFMLEGGSAREFTAAKTLYHTEPALFEALMSKLTKAVVAALQVQVDAGADAVQIFESLGGLIPEPSYESCSAAWIRQVIAQLDRPVPVILFCRGIPGAALPAWSRLGAPVLSVDWTADLAEVRDRVPSHIALQGNLDPIILHTTPAVTARETRRILEAMRHRPGHIFNLGHGITPGARLENLESLVQTVRDFR
jgi:uroporphyrinogen decarboxylase